MPAGSRYDCGRPSAAGCGGCPLPFLHNERFVGLALSRLIDLYALQGSPDRARPLLERLREHAQLVDLRYVHDQVAALEAYLAMACGNLPQALRWAVGGSHEVVGAALYSAAGRIPLMRARILLAEGSPASLQQASQILQALIGYQESQHRWFYLMEALILQGLTWAKLGELALALAVLDKAVQRAVPNGMVGLFIQQGQPMQQLLRVLCKQADHTPLVDLLLAAFPTNSAAAHPEEFLESLSEREVDVLRLMASGLSNKEIAQRLIISIHTVRNHTANIFDKLQVENRLQAVERARALGLLPPVEPPVLPGQRGNIVQG
jgi:LuxR family transcriptional regulator, maltose regulon positive regulatory protein